MKTRDMILVDGGWVCPKCLERNFRKIKRSHSYTTYIKDYDVTADGRFKFMYICDSCNINIIEYDDMKRKGRM